MNGQTVLVTGGVGFIGGHLAERLTPDNDVRILDTAIPTEKTDDTRISADIRDETTVSEAIRDTDVVFHEAALVSVAESLAEPKRSHSINATGTVNVLEAAREHDSSVVFASSAAIYGQPAYTPIDEDHPKAPSSPYGIDKLAADQYTRLYAEQYDLDAVPLRYFNVYGPGQTGGDYAGVITVFIQQALADEEITVHGDGSQTRDFVFIRDVVEANLRAATSSRSGPAYNIGTGESISIRELAELIRDIADSDSDIVHTEPRDGDIDHSKADISRARSELDYEPSVSLREGLERTIEWYRSQ